MAGRRNASGSGTIRRRKDGRWEARYTCGRDPGTGQQVQRSIYGTTQNEVRQKLAEATAAIDRGEYRPPCRFSLADWLTLWLRDFSGNLKPSTMKAYQSIINTRIVPALGAVRLPVLSVHMVQSFYNAMTREGLTAKTVKNVHGVLHKALEKAVDIDYIPKNPAAKCTLPRVSKKAVKPLDDKETAAFMKAIQGDPYERFYLVALFTGLRQSEIVGLSWDCIDFEKGQIHVYRQLQKQGDKYAFETLKNGKTRTITPAAYVMRLLHEERHEQNKTRLLAGALWGNPDDLVFTLQDGRHICHQTAYLRIKKIFADIGIPERRFHDLRHSYAVASLLAGDDVKTVQENLGHHTAAFTLDVYGHVTDRMKQDSARRMDEYITSLL